jgi:hypothetical protein
VLRAKAAVVAGPQKQVAAEQRKEKQIRGHSVTSCP